MKFSCLLKKITFIIVTLMLSLCVLSACDKKGVLEVGFEQGWRLPSLMGAAKCDHTDFDINDVTLDFYFGGLASEYSPDDERISFGVALYFCNEEAYSAIEWDTAYDDIQKIDGMHFIKYISTEDFNSGEYEVYVSRFGKATLQHLEKMTVPSDVFLKDDDHFGLAMLEIYCYKSKSGYYISSAGCLEIKYEFLNAQRVRLSKPEHTFH